MQVKDDQVRGGEWGVHSWSCLGTLSRSIPEEVSTIKVKGSGEHGSTTGQFNSSGFRAPTHLSSGCLPHLSQDHSPCPCASLTPALCPSDTPNPASLDPCLLPPGKLFHLVPLQPSLFHLEVSSNVTYSEKLSRSHSTTALLNLIPSPCFISFDLTHYYLLWITSHHIISLWLSIFPMIQS